MDEQELDKQFQAMESDKQVKAAAAASPPAAPIRRRMTVRDVKKELDGMKTDMEENVLSWLGELAVRLDKLEGAGVENLPEFVPDINARLDNQDAAIGALADALRSRPEEVAATPPTPQTEIEFAQPPQQTAGGQTRAGDITSVASVCQSMGDVLMICRALKADTGTTNQERNDILAIACRSSGVILAPGLQIRAGVKFTGA